MNILLVLVPLALLLAFGAVAAFRWAARHEQFDDLEAPAVRMLDDCGEIDADLSSEDAV
jgi:cbb3-type cytochrome oxidase maturation protein